MIARRTPIMGNGFIDSLGKRACTSRSIAHHERAASARVGVFDAAARDFLGNRSPPWWKFVRRPKRKNQRRFSLKQQRSKRRPDAGEERPLVAALPGQKLITTHSPFFVQNVPFKVCVSMKAERSQRSGIK